MPFPTYAIGVQVEGAWESQDVNWQSQTTNWEDWNRAVGEWDVGRWDADYWDEVSIITDDITNNWRSSSPLRTFRGLDIIQPAIPARAGDAQFTVDNTSGLYNPNTGSLAKGERVVMTATYSAVTYPFWYGYVDHPEHHPEMGTQSVDVPCLGILSSVIAATGGGNKISTALYQNITTDAAISRVLDAVGFPPGNRSLDVGKTTLLWWWVQDGDPWTEIQKILAAEGPTAAIYEDASGKIVFKNRWALNTLSRCNTSQATWSDAAGAAIQIARPFHYDDGQKYVANSARWPTVVRSAKALANIWTGPASISLTANQVLVLSPNASSGNPFTAAVVPVAATDYTLVSGAVVMTLDRTSGQGVKLTLTGGAAGASITGLVMRAQVVSVDSTTDIVNVVGAPLATDVRSNPLSVQMTSELSPTTAQGLCDSYVGLWANGRPYVTVSFVNVNDAALVQQLGRELLDRVTVVEQGISLNTDFFISSIEHDVSEGGALIKTTFKCLLAAGIYGSWDSGVWDTAVWGF